MKRRIAFSLACMALLTALAAGQGKDQDAYDSATLLFNNEEYDLAAGEYKKLVDAKDRAVAAKSAFKLAECQFQLKKYEVAQGLFKGYLEGNPGHEQRPEAQFRLAECAYFLRNHAQAAKGYERFLEDNPNHDLAPLALYAAAGACVETGAFDRAREFYQRLAERFPKHEKAEEALFNLGWVFLKAKDFDRAGDGFLEFSKRYPKSRLAAEALLRAADSRYRKDRYKESIELYNRVLAEGEGAFGADARQGVAWNYYRMKEFDKAAGAFLDFARAAEAGEPKATAYFQAIQSFYSARKTGAGIAAAAEMIEKCPKSGLAADAWYWKGVFLRQDGKDDEALAAFRQALALKPAKVAAAEVTHDMATLLIAQKKHAEAVALLQEARKDAADASLLAKVLYDLARAQHLAGQTEEAVQVSREYLKSANPADETALLSRFNLGEYLFAQKKYAEALDSYQAVLKGTGEGQLAEDARYRQGWCLKFLDKPKDAAQAFAAMKLDDPKNRYAQEARFLLAELQEKSGDKDKARQGYQELVQRRGAFSGDASLALAQMHFQEKDYARAAALMKQFLAEYAGHALEPNARFLLAESCYWLGQHEAAVQAYDQVIGRKDSPLAVNALYGKAWLLYEKGRPDDALALLDKLLKEYPQSSYVQSALQLQGKIYVGQGKPEKAKEVYQQAVAQVPEAEREAFLLGLAGVETDLRNYDKALALYEDFGKKYPASKQAGHVLYQKGWLLMQLGKPAEATALLARYKAQHAAGDLAPDVDFAMGEIAYGAKDYTQAATHYAASGKSPRYLDKALYKGAWCRANQEDHAGAAALFGELAEKCPASPLREEAVYRQGLSHLKAGAFDKAAAALQACAAGAKDGAFRRDALFNLGKVHEKLERPDKAAEAYRAYLDAAPEGDLRGEAEVALGNICLEGKRYTEARGHYAAVAADKTHHLVMEALFGLGEANFHLEQYQEAIKSFLEIQRYKEGGKWKAAGLWRIAQCHKALGNADKVGKYLDQLCKDYPGSEFAQKAETERKKTP